MEEPLLCLENTALSSWRLLEWHIKAGEGQGVRTGFLPCVKLILIQAENLSSTGKQKCTAFRDILLHKGPIYSIKILWPLCRVPLNSQGTSMAALWCGWSVFSRTEIQPSIASNIGSFLQNVLLNRNHSTLLVCNSVLKMLFRNDTWPEKLSWLGNESQSCKIFCF